MWHATYIYENQSDSRLLVIESQTSNLTPWPSFGHNLCFKYPNGSCDHILDICIPRIFQWYKELINPMSFDLCNHPLKTWKSIVTSTPKVGVHLGVWGFIPSLSCTPMSMKCDSRAHSWFALLQAFALVTNLGLGLRQPSLYFKFKLKMPHANYQNNN
jgi:hypothetical protein